MTSTLRAAGYGRVSRTNRREKTPDRYHSKPMQREKCEKLAAAHGAELAEWIFEENVSGGNRERVGFQRAIEMIENGEADIIVVPDLSRFARRTRDLLEAYERITAAGGRLVLGDIGDTSGHLGKLFLTIVGAIAEMERVLKEEGLAETRARACAKGVYARKTPVGYRKTKERTLRVDPATGPLVREAFERRAGGASWAELFDWWEKSGGPPISRSGMASMFTNRTYLGEYWEDGRLVDEVEVPPLVSLQLFDAAGRKVTTRRARKNGSLLAGLLTCGTCGRPMTRKGTARYPEYKCQGFSKDGRCPRMASVKMAMADEAVEKAFLTRARSARRYTVTEEHDVALAEAAEAYESAEGELAAYMQAASAASDPAVFLRHAEERIARRDEARERLAQVHREQHALTVHTDVVAMWPHMPTETRRKILEAVLASVVVRPHDSGGRFPRSTRDSTFEDRAEIVFRANAF